LKIIVTINLKIRMLAYITNHAQTKTNISMKTVKELCDKNNWTSLETVYKNANTTMKWKCNVCTFEWKSNYNNTRKSKGCSRCRKGSYKYTHQDVVLLAHKKGCKPIENYKRSNISMNWECLKCSYK